MGLVSIRLQAAEETTYQQPKLEHLPLTPYHIPRATHHSPLMTYPMLDHGCHSLRLDATDERGAQRPPQRAILA